MMFEHSELCVRIQESSKLKTRSTLETVSNTDVLKSGTVASLKPDAMNVCVVA